MRVKLLPFEGQSLERLSRSAPPSASQSAVAPPSASQSAVAPPSASQSAVAPPSASQSAVAPPSASQSAVTGISYKSEFGGNVLSVPYDIAFEPDGDLLVANRGASKISVFLQWYFKVFFWQL